MICWRREPQDHRIRARLAITHPQPSHSAITSPLSDFAVPVRFPLDKLVKTYKFDDINTAFNDSYSGATVKPVVIF